MGCDHTRALDADVLREILKRIPDIDRLRNVPLVSLRLSQACQDPALWPSLFVRVSDFQTEADWNSFLRWLVPHASWLQTLRFDEAENLDARQPPAAWAPRVQDLLAVLAARAPQLRSLYLDNPHIPIKQYFEASPHFPVADLKHLSQLTSLILKLGDASIESAPLATVLRALPALEHLALTSTRSTWKETLISVATSCPQLTCLQITGYSHQSLHLDIEEIGLLTNLVELTFDYLSLYSLPDSISKLTSLQRLLIVDYHDPAVELPSGLTACQQLSQLRIPSDEASPVLADLRALRRLEITQYSEMLWVGLTGLTDLKLTLSFDDNEGLEGLVGMTNLRKLTLECVSTENIPEGPYLNALESICLENCIFSAGLPSSLAAATKLRHAELREGHNAYDHPDLFFSVLELLQALETLHMSFEDSNMTTSDLAPWNDNLTQYRSRCSAQGRSPVKITYT